MTRAPHALRTRPAPRMGDEPMIDVMVHDGLYCSIADVGMGAMSDAENARLGITREAQDELRGALARQRAAAGRERLGRGDRPARRARPRRGRARDEPRGARGAAARLQRRRHDHRRQRQPGLRRGRRRPSSRPRTALRRAAGRGRRPRRRRRAGLDAAPAARRGLAQAARTATASSRRTSRCGRSTRPSPASCRVGQALEIDLEHVNVNGGAVALGHPLAGSGLRLVLTLAYELRRRGGGYGVATLCGGGGQGEAILLSVGRFRHRRSRHRRGPVRPRAAAKAARDTGPEHAVVGRHMALLARAHAGRHVPALRPGLAPRPARTSTPRALPGERCQRRPAPARRFLDYAEWFQDAGGLQIADEHVTALRRAVLRTPESGGADPRARGRRRARASRTSPTARVGGARDGRAHLRPRRLRAARRRARADRRRPPERLRVGRAARASTARRTSTSSTATPRRASTAVELALRGPADRADARPDGLVAQPARAASATRSPAGSGRSAG